jgi:hypothetical protein
MLNTRHFVASTATERFASQSMEALSGSIFKQSKPQITIVMLRIEDL